MRGSPKARVLARGTGLVVLASLLFAPAVQAAFPGGNGLITLLSTRSGAQQLYVQELGAPTPTQLPFSEFGATDVYEGAFSPDGKRLAFGFDNGLGTGIGTMNADGTEATGLFLGAADVASPQFSADGEKIVYQSDEDGSDDIWIVNADGSLPAKLYNDGFGFDERAPTFAPDGSRVAFHRDAGGGDNIFTVNAGGGDLQPLVASAADDRNPDYSPDGATVAFGSDRNGNDDIFVTPAGGGGVTPLTDDAGSDIVPRFSPDGTKILFASNRRAGGLIYDVWVMNADGSGEEMVEGVDAIDIATGWQPLDVAAPALETDFQRRQRVERAIKLDVSCDEDCTLKIGSSAKPKRAGAAAKKIKLPSVSEELLAGEETRIKLKPKGRSKRKLRRAIRRGQRVKVKLKLTATDEAGNRATEKITVKSR